jgi:hypothetical protein
MAIGRNQRYATAAEMRCALRECVSRDHQPKPKLPPTIKAPSRIKKTPRQQTDPRRQSTITGPPPERLADEVRANPPLVFGEASPSASLDQIPSTTLFEAPMEKIDRFALARKVGLFVFLLILALIVIGFVGSMIGPR